MDAEERELLDCFRQASCKAFSHEEHVHVAWMLLRQNSLIDAIALFTQGARDLAASHGRSEFYHETITWAYMILVNERIHKYTRGDWAQFHARNSDLFASDKAILRKYYREATLESAFARRVFVFPDAMDFSNAMDPTA
jgi:hypothetical protein